MEVINVLKLCCLLHFLFIYTDFHSTLVKALSQASNNLTLQNTETKKKFFFKLGTEPGGLCILEKHSTLGSVPCHSHSRIMVQIIKFGGSLPYAIF